MPSLSTYERECVTLDKDEMKECWTSTLSRLAKEWKRIEAEQEELKKDGIYFKVKEDLSEFTIMILKEKDGGPYNYTPLVFSIKPCRNKTTGECYPLIPPIVRFHSFDGKYIHPNFKPSGDVCISLLEYSYIGSGVAQWNPSIGIKAIAVILSSLIEEGALRKEPNFSNELLTSVKTIDYDRGAQYICMLHTVKTLKYIDEALFKEVLTEKQSDIITYILSNSNERKDVYVHTYGFTVTTKYMDLYDSARELVHSDPHSN